LSVGGKICEGEVCENIFPGTKHMFCGTGNDNGLLDGGLHGFFSEDEDSEDDHSIQSDTRDDGEGEADDTKVDVDSNELELHDKRDTDNEEGLCIKSIDDVCEEYAKDPGEEWTVGWKDGTYWYCCIVCNPFRNPSMSRFICTLRKLCSLFIISASHFFCSSKSAYIDFIKNSFCVVVIHILEETDNNAELTEQNVLTEVAPLSIKSSKKKQKTVGKYYKYLYNC